MQPAMEPTQWAVGLRNMVGLHVYTVNQHKYKRMGIVMRCRQSWEYFYVVAVSGIIVSRFFIVASFVVGLETGFKYRNYAGTGTIV